MIYIAALFLFVFYTFAADLFLLTFHTLIAAIAGGAAAEKTIKEFIQHLQGIGQSILDLLLHKPEIVMIALSLTTVTILVYRQLQNKRLTLKVK